MDVFTDLSDRRVSFTVLRVNILLIEDVVIDFEFYTWNLLFEEKFFQKYLEFLVHSYCMQYQYTRHDHSIKYF